MLVAERVHVKGGNLSRDMPAPDGSVVPVSFAVIAFDFHLINAAGEFTVAMPREVGQSMYELMAKALNKKPGLVIPDGVNGNELRQ